MSFSINNSLAANSMSYNNNTNESKDAVSKALDRIATGHAVENASQSAIHHSLQVDQMVSAQEAANANQSVARLQIADSGLNSLQENTEKIKELSVKMNSAALGDNQKASIQSEIDGLKESMGQIIDTTEYNGQKLISDVNLDSFNDSDLDSIDDFMQNLSEIRSQVGASMNQAQSEVDTLNVKIVNTAAAQSQMGDTDIAAEVNNLNINDLKMQSSLFAQAHNNQFLAQQVGSLLG